MHVNIEIHKHNLGSFVKKKLVNQHNFVKITDMYNKQHLINHNNNIKYNGIMCMVIYLNENKINLNLIIWLSNHLLLSVHDDEDYLV